MDLTNFVVFFLMSLITFVHHTHAAIASYEDFEHHRVRRDVIEEHKITALNRTLCQLGAEVPSTRVDTAERVIALRNVMKWPNVSLDAYLVVYEDEHINSPAPYDRRLGYISGFSGSNGYAWILGEDWNNKQALWTDGRYFLQVDEEMDCNWILMKQSTEGYPSPIQWLKQLLPENSRLGMNPKLVSTARWQAYEEALEGILELVVIEQDLIDYIWKDGRPPRPNEPLFIHTLSYTGMTWGEKLERVRGEMEEEQALFLTALDDIAWLFNLRGYDRSTSPLFYSYALITHTYSRLYLVNFRQLLTTEIQTHLNTRADGICFDIRDTCVVVREYETALQDLQQLNNEADIRRILISPSSSYATYLAAGDMRDVKASPIQLMKSIKNKVEKRNYHACQIRDSAAVVDFASQLEEKIESGEQITELEASNMLTDIRSEDDRYVMNSFDTVAASGANAAVIHYRPTPITDSLITTDGVFLVDSGGQYYDATTDVTRTFHFGQPTDLEIEAYTRVLIGAIDLATTVWPEGLRGTDLDIRARAKLYEVGWDYNHGTGHGIGYFLNVHEGPGRISKGYRAEDAPLQAGMYFSDEPGIYLDGLFGIRLETIVEVVVKDTERHFNNRDYLGLEPVTFVPFEPKLIDYNMLSATHRRWLNEYNKNCKMNTGSLLREQGKMNAFEWLLKRTEHIPDVPMWSDSTTTDGAATINIPNFYAFISLVVSIIRAIYTEKFLLCC